MMVEDTGHYEGTHDSLAKLFGDDLAGLTLTLAPEFKACPMSNQYNAFDTLISGTYENNCPKNCVRRRVFLLHL